jgi:exodeoxyribonuclease V gamma subunit
MLKIWLLHLVLNCTKPSASILIGKGLMQSYQPVENSGAFLKELLTLYWRGLREPLRFFPRSSHAFAKGTLEPEEGRDPQRMVNAEWLGDQRNAIKSEQCDAYINLAFRNVSEPLDREWQKLALEVFTPLFKNRTETKF